MAIDLNVLAAGGGFPVAQNNVVYTAPAPNGSFGCNEGCVMPATPGYTPLRSPVQPQQCKISFTFEQSGTGATGFTHVFGLEQVDAQAAAQLNCTVCDCDNLDTDTFPISTSLRLTDDGTGEAPIVPPVVIPEEDLPITGTCKLGAFNRLAPDMIISNIVVSIDAASDADINDQANEDITLITIDVNNNMSECTTTLEADLCPPCPNGNSDVRDRVTFSASACPIFITSTSGFAYTQLATTTELKVQFCVEASEVVVNYTNCGA